MVMASEYVIVKQDVDKMIMAMFMVQVIFLLRIFSDVESQYMPQPQMPGMQFQMPMNAGAPMPMGQPMAMPPMGIPGQMQMPMPSPMQMANPMPMPMSFMSQPKLPMVVMPFKRKSERSTDRRRYKKSKRRPKKYVQLPSIESDDSTSSDSEVDFRRRSRGGGGRRRQVLTPVISYVTKDGYVVYQKKIKKDKAKDWLDIGKRSVNQEETEVSSSEEALRKALKKKLKKVKRKNRV